MDCWASVVQAGLSPVALHLSHRGWRKTLSTPGISRTLPDPGRETWQLDHDSLSLSLCVCVYECTYLMYMHIYGYICACMHTLNTTYVTFSFKKLIHSFSPVFLFWGFRRKEVTPKGREQIEAWGRLLAWRWKIRCNLMTIVVCVHNLEYFFLFTMFNYFKVKMFKKIKLKCLLGLFRL